jgi:hypothetical protein
MITTTSTGGISSTLREWSNFLSVLNTRKFSDQPLIRKTDSPVRIIDHLEKQFNNEQAAASIQRGWYTVRKVKRRIPAPGQLMLQLS